MQEANLAVVWRPIESVHPYARNPRVIPPSAIEKVAASIREFGWRQPLVVDDDGSVIVGHTRLLAARHLGLASVPVHVAAGLTAAQVKAYRLADNRVGEETRWDLGILGHEIAELSKVSFDLGSIGFDPIEIAAHRPIVAAISEQDVKPLDQVDASTCPTCGARRR